MDKPEQLTPRIEGTKYVKKALDKRSEQSKEDHARWRKDHPTKQPGENSKGKGWKSYSAQRFASDAYRDGYSRIRWTE